MTRIGRYDERNVVVDFGVFFGGDDEGQATEMSLIGRDGKGVFAEGKFELFNGGIVGNHCRGGHGWHFMWFDAELAGDSI